MIERIFAYHAMKYPLMQPQDAVKLLYQHSFGVGHLIPDSRAFLERLLRETEETGTVPGIPLTEPIGNGLVRVMLASSEFSRITAAEPFDSMETFLEKLAVLEDACRNGIFSFTPGELEDYLTAYRAAGFPPVSHSEIYRLAYHPAYRVAKAGLIPMNNEK